jgi:hypothetical protein
LTSSNNFIRGTGDDAHAINSVNYNDINGTRYYYTRMSNITVVNNTSVAPWGGKGQAIYGGAGHLVAENLITDTARYIGLGVGKFGVNGSDLESATVVGNTVLRSGGNGYQQQQAAMMIGNGGDGQSSGTVASAYCASNTIQNSLFYAVAFSTGTNIVFQRNTIIAPGLDGIVIGPTFFEAMTGTGILNSNSVTGLNAGRVAFTNFSSAYAAITPIAAANYSSMSGVTAEISSEGWQDVGSINPGDWTAYNNVTLTGVNTFVARVASAGAGGNIEIHLDGPAGTLVGTCPVTGTGSSQNYKDVYCSISGASGVHTVYLVYTGGGANLCNVEFFGFFAAPPEFSHRLVIGNTYSLNALANGKYVTADNGGTNALIAKSVSVGAAEQFQVVDAGGGNIGLLALVNSNYVCADNGGASPLIANRTAVGSWETFTEFDSGNGNIALRAMNNGKYVSADNAGASPLIAKSSSIGVWESFTPGFVSGLPPATPGGLTAVPVGDSQVVLSWVPSLGATGYNVKRSFTSGGSYVIIATNISLTSYTDSGLTLGTTYYYEVSALNPAGESMNSPYVTAMPGSLNRAAWVASASVSSSGDPPGNAIDGNINTRWSTGTPQVNGQWFQVDMASTNTMYRLVLDAAASSSDYPRGYQVNLSNDGITWGSPVATGAGSSALTTISFPTNTARYIRVTQTGSVGGLWWSIHEFNVFGRIGTVSVTPPQLSFGIDNGVLQFAWPSDHTGWRLQAQTNSVGSGLGSNWVTVSGSATTNQISIPLDRTVGNAFFRLVYP